MFDHDAAIDDYAQSCRGGLLCSLSVDRVELHPGGSRACRDGCVDNSGDVLRPSENIDNIDMPDDVGQVGHGVNTKDP